MCLTLIVWLTVNEVADRVTKKAARELLPVYVAQVSERARAMADACSFLSKQFVLRADLSQMRAQLLKTQEIQECWEPAEVASDFISHAAAQPMDFSLADQKWDVIPCRRHGQVFNEFVLLRWLQTIRWPTTGDTRQPPVGISWFELSVFFDHFSTDNSYPGEQRIGGR